MPNIHAPLPETEQNIFRPIVMDIVTQVQTIVGLSDIQIHFPDENNKVQTSGAGIDNKTDNYLQTTSKRLNTIEVKEEVDKEEMSPTFFDAREYPPIFQDRQLGVALSPVYAKHNVVITFNYRCDSKNESIKWLTDIRMKLSRLRDINLHTVTYHYNLHSVFYSIIRKIYDLREKVAGYNETFSEYVKKHASSRLTTISDLTNKHSILAVSERQTEICGIFDFDALPERPSKDQASGMWNISFDYSFNYDKVIGCHMKYPIIVHNQPLPKNLVEFTSEQVRPISVGSISTSVSQNAFLSFRTDFQMDRIIPEDSVLRIPTFDDFKPGTLLGASSAIFQVLASVGEQDKRDVLNLHELDSLVIDDDILDFIKKSEFPYLGKPYKSIFNIGLYQNENLQGRDSITIDSNLNVRTVFDMDLRKQYRLRFSIIVNLALLDFRAIEVLRENPTVLSKVIAAINDAYRENSEFNNLGIHKPMTREEFIFFYGLLLDKNFLSNYGKVGWDINGLFSKFGVNETLARRLLNGGRFRASVMYTGVIAKRKSDDSNSISAGNIDLKFRA